MLCPKCGAENVSETTYCHNCGFEILEPSKIWRILSLVLAAITFMGMFLPWIRGLSLASLSGGRVSGWNIRKLPITIILGLIFFVGSVFVKIRWLRLIGIVATLFCCVVSLLIITDLGYVALGFAEEDLYGTFMITSYPLVGFWFTLLSSLGMFIFELVFGIKVLLKK